MAAAEEYETVSVPSGELHQVQVRSGDVLENKLFDITADGAGLHIDARGDGWVIRNIGVHGAQGRPSVVIKPACGRGETGLIENVYLGDGHDKSQSGDMKAGILAHADQDGDWPHHYGHVTFRHVNVQGFGDGIYMSGPAVWTPDAAGTSTIEQCYGRSNNVAQFRVAKDGDVVRDSVALAYQGETPSNTSGVTNGRGIRAVDGNGTEALAVNCDVESDWAGFQAASGSILRAKDSRVNASPDTSGDVVTENLNGGPDTAVPSGVPTSPEEAASGSGGDTGNSDSPSRLVTIDGVGELAHYEFTVEGDLEKSTENGASIDSGDEIDGSTATGAVYGGADSYRFSGEFTAFSLDGDATVTVDGEEVDPTLLDLQHAIDISGPSGSVTSYEFTVSDELAGVDLNDEDSVDGTTATGAVAGGTDSYQYAGAITDFSADGDLTVRVDGEEVDPALLGLSRTVEISGGSSGDVVGYEFTVSDELAGVDINDEDTVDGTTATGSVAGGSDSYRFDGEIVTFSLDGDATVLVDGEEADPALFLPNRLVFEGGGGGESTYEFAVSGELAGDPELGALESDDTIDGSAASGAVTDDRDGYRFSGDLVSLRTDGTVDVVFEDTDG